MVSASIAVGADFSRRVDRGIIFVTGHCAAPLNYTKRVVFINTISIVAIVDIRYSKQATKYLLKLQPKKAKKILQVIKHIAAGNTEGLNITTMHELDAYRVRVGDFRVIYEIRDEGLVLIVIKIGARGDVYK